MTSFFRLLRYARPYRGRLILALVAMVVYGAASYGLVRMVAPILDAALPRQERLAQTIGLILALYLTKGIGAYVSSYLMTDVGQRVVRDLRNLLFRHILGQSAAFFSQQTSGRLLSRITNDVSQVQRAVSETLGDLGRESIALFWFAFLLFQYHSRLALFCLTSAPLIVYPLARLGQRVRRSTRRSQEALEEITHISAEAFTGHRIVKAFGAEEREATQFERASAYLYRTSMKVTSALSVLPPLMEFIGGVAFVLALYFGSREIGAGRLTTGEFVSFVTALFMMYTPAKKLSRVNADLQQAMAASERIFTMLDTHTEVHERPDATTLPPFGGTITYDRVELRYDGTEEPALKGVTFEVRGGPDGGARRPQRRRQDHARQSPAAVLRRHRWPHPDRRPRRARRDAGIAAQPDRHRDAGDGAVRRHHRGQHRLWTPGGHHRGDRGGRTCGARARVHHGDARRIQHPDR